MKTPNQRNIGSDALTTSGSFNIDMATCGYGDFIEEIEEHCNQEKNVEQRQFCIKYPKPTLPSHVCVYTSLIGIMTTFGVLYYTLFYTHV